MTTSDADDVGGSLRRMVDESIIIGHRAKVQYRQARANNAVSEQVLQDLRDSVIEYYSALKRWRDDSGVSQQWEEGNLDQLERFLTETVTVEQSVSGSRGNVTQTQQVPRLRQLSGEQLASIIDRLDGVAKDLGFAPSTTQRTPLEIGTLEDVRWLMKTRNQSQALDDLEPPIVDDDDVATDGGVSAQTPGVAGANPANPDVPQEVETGPGGRFPFRGPFFQEISKRKAQGKDAKISVSSANAETGVGKSTCAYFLELILDTSDQGFVADDKATYDVDTFLGAYDTLPKGSALGLEEAEQIDARRAMSHQNVDAAQRWQTRRVQEICAVLTLPKFEVLDSRMRDLVDYRVEIERRGRAVIYKKSHKRFSGDIWWQPLQRLEYPNMDGTTGMQELHEGKQEFIDGEGGDENYVPESEVNKRVKEELKKQQQKRQEGRIVELAEDGCTAPEIADDPAVDVTARRVRQKLGEEGYTWDGSQWEK